MALCDQLLDYLSLLLAEGAKRVEFHHVKRVTWRQGFQVHLKNLEVLGKDGLHLRQGDDFDVLLPFNHLPDVPVE